LLKWGDRKGSFRFEGGEAFIQNFKLSKGWNWVSFNVESEQLSDMDAMLSSMHWNDGDAEILRRR